MKCKYDYILIVGENNAGKSTFAKALGGVLGMRVGETSAVLNAPLAKILMDQERSAGRATYTSLEDCLHTMRDNPECFRAGKRALGDMMCESDPAYLVRKCAVEGAKVIVGMRRPEEVRVFLSELVESCGATVMLVIVYRAADDQAIEPASAFLAIPVATEEVLNNGNLDDLRRAAVRFAESISE